MPPRLPPRRRRSALIAAVAAGLTCALIAPQAGAAPRDPATDDDALVLSSGALDIEVSREFPQIVSYTYGNDAKLLGRAQPLSSVTLNGKAYDTHVTANRSSSSRAVYKLTFPDLDGVWLTASLSVEGTVATFAVDKIVDTKDFRVHTIDIPDHDLLSVSSAQSGAKVAAARISPDRATSGDSVDAVSEDSPTQDKPTGSAYGIVHTDKVAAAIETNSVYDESEGPAEQDNGRIWRQTRKDGEERRTSLWSGQWTYRAQQSPFTEELPWAKVTLTGDRNDDDTVDWQDGAIALREITSQPKGAEKTADRVVTHIPFNFGSEATHPFLRTLDDVKRISLATDGLGQLALLKGYQSEGHDSAHPDYGDNVNQGAGGLKDLNKLLAQGEKWGADFGVHVNATEAYPEAKNFSEQLVDPKQKGWNWLDQSYYMDQRRDLVSGDIQKRFAKLREQTHRNLEFLYFDVYYSHGWLAERVAKEVRDQGWQLGTEWSDRFEESSLWSHWATDEEYGGTENKGINSEIIRFVRNHEKDVWNPHPILGNPEVREFEGWTGQVDWNHFYDNIWDRNLPAKFLQQEQITRWAKDEIHFTGDVRATDKGGRQFFVGDKRVLNGDTYLLPWQSAEDGEKTSAPKLYHHNKKGGETTWQLTDAFAANKTLKLYELTDQGRKFVAEAPVKDGAVTLDAKANTPYVLDGSDTRAKPAQVKWGQGGQVADPGFDSGSTESWRTTGDVDVARNARGQYEARLHKGEQAGVEQELTGLTPGTYEASAQLEVQPGKSRKTTLAVDAEGESGSTQLERSTAQNWTAADEKHGTYMQRVRTYFTVPEGSDRATLSVKAAAGDADVKVDNVRVVATKYAPKLPEGVLVDEDFESPTRAWHPFVKGDAGKVTDSRTHRAEKNAPYTQRGWNGKLVDDVLDGDWSLKSHSENTGLVYRTSAHSVAFQEGRRYRVSFDHQSGREDRYTWVTGYDTIEDGAPKSVKVNATKLGERHRTSRFSEEFTTTGCGDFWVGLEKNDQGEAGDQGDLIMDNLRVEDLGPATKSQQDNGSCAKS